MTWYRFSPVLVFLSKIFATSKSPIILYTEYNSRNPAHTKQFHAALSLHLGSKNHNIEHVYFVYRLNHLIEIIEIRNQQELTKMHS